MSYLGLDTMANKETPQQTQKRILILCVDRDGDLEVKAGIKTPLLGRTANLDAAVALALKDPEEPDANAMFEAIRLYDRLQNEKKPEEIFEVATISGTELSGVSADRKLVAELNKSCLKLSPLARLFLFLTVTLTRQFCLLLNPVFPFHQLDE